MTGYKELRVAGDEQPDVMELSECIGKAMHYARRAMSIAEAMGGAMGQRYGYGERTYGADIRRGDMGMRDDERQYDEYGNPMGMRRDSRGRFM